MKTRLIVMLGCLAACVVTAPTAAAASPALKPTLSVALSERFDSNVMLQDHGALQRIESWVTSVQPVLGVSQSWAGPWPWSLRLQYAPDFTFFHERDEESYLRHTGLWRFEGRNDRFSAWAQVRPQYTDGSSEGPIWSTPEEPGSTPALGAAEVRYRRRNFYWQSPLEARYDRDGWFARGVFEARVWDIMVEDRQVPGSIYQNYVDRTDVVGGPDLGLKVAPGWQVSAGYRFGHQDHEQHPFAEPYTYQNDFHRGLGGLNVSPAAWLKIGGEAGPSFHQFNRSSLPPGADPHETLLYYAFNLTARLGTNTTLQGQGSQHLLPSTGGRATFQNIRLTGTLEHRLRPDLRAAFRFDMQEYDMIRGLNTRDQVFTPEARLEYTLNRHFAFNAWYAYEWADALESGTEGREYSRHVVGLGLRATY